MAVAGHAIAVNVNTGVLSYDTATSEDRGNGAASANGVECLPRYGLTEFDAVSGQLYVSYVTPSASGTLTKLMVASGSVAATAVTLCRLGLFTVAADGSLTLVARTASQTTIGAVAYTPYEFAMATAGGYPASYAISAGTRYALGFLQVASVGMKVQGVYVLDPPSPVVPSRYITGQTDIAATYAIGALTANFTMVYLRSLP